MNIDWSKAPEGFDFHFQGKGKQDPGKFYNADTDRFVSESGSYILYADIVAWKSEGLPPAGSAYEFSLNLGKVDWEKGAFLAHDVVFDVMKRNIHGDRLIRSPEQIAAEKREIAVAQMLADGGQDEVLFELDCKDMAGKLYDAGYRKFEIVEGE